MSLVFEIISTKAETFANIVYHKQGTCSFQLDA